MRYRSIFLMIRTYYLLPTNGFPEHCQHRPEYPIEIKSDDAMLPLQVVGNEIQGQQIGCAMEDTALSFAIEDDLHWLFEAVFSF